MSYGDGEIFPDAGTPFEADRTSRERRRKILVHEAQRVGVLADSHGEVIGEGNAALALAVLAVVDHGWHAALPRDRGDPVTIVNDYLLSCRRGTVGTKIEYGVVFKDGDYDFALVLLIRIAYHYAGYLTEQVRDHLVGTLLTERGRTAGTGEVVLRIPDGLPFIGGNRLITLPETENHITGIEVSRYLTNQLEGADNNDLGSTDFLIGWLTGFLCNDFLEFNARNYQNYTVRSITVLRDLAADPRVRNLAGLVLDYLTAKFAVSSNALRRHVPFRRLNDHDHTPDDLFNSNADQEAPRWLALTGLRRLYSIGDPGLNSMSIEITVPAVLSTFRPQLAMLNLMMDNRGKSYFQRFRHAGVEVFSSTPEVLISAGGIWVDGRYGAGQFGIGGKDASHPLPNVVIPSADGVRESDLARIIGVYDRPDQQVNTGVAAGFMCGVNLQIPAGLREARDVRTHGPLTLVDGTTLARPQRVYYAFHQRPLPLLLSENLSWTIVAAAGSMTFDTFERDLLTAGAAHPMLDAPIHYVKAPTVIPPVAFSSVPGNDRVLWPIRGPNGEWIDTRSWPLAAGDVMNSEQHTGVIHIDHPWLRALDRRCRVDVGVRADFGRRGIAGERGFRAALRTIIGTSSGSVREALLGGGVKEARRISAPLSLRDGASRRDVPMDGGVRAALRSVTGMPPEGLTSLRTALTLLRRRTTLDGPRLRRIGPRYTLREVALLAGADPGQGARRLFGHQRGLAEIALSDFVGHGAGRFSVGEACRVIGADPSHGLRHLFPAQNDHRVDAYRLSTLLRPE